MRLAAAHSTPTAASVAALVARDWDLGPVAACRLLHRSLADSFLVEAASGAFVLRLTRHGWRGPAEVADELRILAHLRRNGACVPVAVPARDGAGMRLWEAPEGERPAVLFARMPGRWARPVPAECRAVGIAAAGLHAAASGLEPGPATRRLDLDHLLEAPLAAMRPCLAHRPADRDALERIADDLRARLAPLLPALETGFLHGDLYEENALVDAATGAAGLVDLDCGGVGWRAYDLAVFRWYQAWTSAGGADALWAAFLDGYRSRRPLAAADIEATALFVPLRAIWLRGLHCRMAEDWGVQWLNEP